MARISTPKRGVATRSRATKSISIASGPSLSNRSVGPGGPTDRFESDGPLAIEIDFVARERVATPLFGVEIRAIDGTLCYGTNTRRDTYPVESVEGRGTASFAIDRLPLHEGRFLLTVAVTSADESEVYHWIDRRFELSVFAKSGGVGLVRFDGRWSVSEEPSGARTRITVDG